MPGGLDDFEERALKVSALLDSLAKRSKKKIQESSSDDGTPREPVSRASQTSSAGGGNGLGVNPATVTADSGVARSRYPVGVQKSTGDTGMSNRRMQNQDTREKSQGKMDLDQRQNAEISAGLSEQAVNSSNVRLSSAVTKRHDQVCELYDHSWPGVESDTDGHGTLHRCCTGAQVKLCDLYYHL